MTNQMLSNNILYRRYRVNILNPNMINFMFMTWLNLNIAQILGVDLCKMLIRFTGLLRKDTDFSVLGCLFHGQTRVSERVKIHVCVSHNFIHH